MTFEEKFNNWWDFYPRKVGRGKAKPAFKRALEKTTYEILLEAVQEFSGCVQKWPKEFRSGEKHYVPHPTTWLNQERWEDDREEWKRFIPSGAPKLSAAAAWELVAKVRKQCGQYSPSAGTIYTKNESIIGTLPPGVRELALQLWSAMNASDNPSQVFLRAYREK